MAITRSPPAPNAGGSNSTVVATTTNAAATRRTRFVLRRDNVWSLMLNSFTADYRCFLLIALRTSGHRDEVTRPRCIEEGPGTLHGRGDELGPVRGPGEAGRRGRLIRREVRPVRIDVELHGANG